MGAGRGRVTRTVYIAQKLDRFTCTDSSGESYLWGKKEGEGQGQEKY